MFASVDKTDQWFIPDQTAVTGADPAAAAECSITVPAGERWLLHAVTVSLVQGISQTPWPQLVLKDENAVVLAASNAGTAAQAASTTTRHCWFPGAGVTQVGTTPNIVTTGPIPPGMILDAGATITTSTSGIGANTNYGVPVAFVTKLPAP